MNTLPKHKLFDNPLDFQLTTSKKIDIERDNFMIKLIVNPINKVTDMYLKQFI